MRLNPFGGGGRHGQSPRELRAECERLTAAVADRDERLVAADKLITATAKERDTTAEERDWFHERWVEVGHQATEAGLVVVCLEKQLAKANRKVADLEAIAGPHVDATDEPSPIFSEITLAIPLPVDVPEPEADADSEATAAIAVRELRDAMAVTG